MLLIKFHIICKNQSCEKLIINLNMLEDAISDAVPQFTVTVLLMSSMIYITTHTLLQKSVHSTRNRQ
jgi:hypothetical protein